MKKAVVILMVMILVVTSCQGQEKKIVLASKPMTEQYILAEILSQLIEGKTDIEVEEKLGIGGGTSNIQPGLLSGDIDLYPEYTGTGWLFVLKEDLIQDPDALYQAVKEAYKREYNLVWSGLYGFNNTYVLALKSSQAEDYELKTMGDLARVSDQLVFGANYDFYEREDGYKGLTEAYGLMFKDEVEMDIGLKYQALKEGEVDVTPVFSTDGKLGSYDLTLLEDDINFFPSYYCGTVIRQETLDTYPELVPILDLLTDSISNDTMRHMNYLVDIEKQDPQTVASDFINENGWLSD